jgi:hypothetical protein
MTLRAVVWAIPYSSLIWRKVGICSPGWSSPDSIFSLSAANTRSEGSSEALGTRSGYRRASDLVFALHCTALHYYAERAASAQAVPAVAGTRWAAGFLEGQWKG